MSPVTASQYCWDADSKKKKVTARKPTFLTKEKLEAKKRYEERKHKVINQSAISIDEYYTSIS